MLGRMSRRGQKRLCGLTLQSWNLMDSQKRFIIWPCICKDSWVTYQHIREKMFSISAGEYFYCILTQQLSLYLYCVCASKPYLPSEGLVLFHNVQMHALRFSPVRQRRRWERWISRRGWDCKGMAQEEAKIESKLSHVLGCHIDGKAVTWDRSASER